ncbi:hypothetical protein D3C76_1484730 [compost metagenome]
MYELKKMNPSMKTPIIITIIPIKTILFNINAAKVIKERQSIIIETTRFERTFRIRMLELARNTSSPLFRFSKKL